MMDDTDDDWPRHAAIEIEAMFPEIDEESGLIEQVQQDAEAGMEHRWQAIEAIIRKHWLAESGGA